MPYKKQYNGGSFGPGGSFPDRCLFQNCTIVADVTFGDHCDFVNCTFVKCCPKAYSNVSRTGTHCRFFDCQLESVNVGQHAELYNTNRSGYLVTVQSTLPNASKTETRGNTETLSSQTCAKCGNRINSLEAKKDNEFRDHCKVSQPTEGYSDVEVKRDECMCGEMKKGG